MAEYRRYAVFYTPPPGHLADFGAAWLGWDSAAGVAVPHPHIPDLDIAQMTARARAYGLHGTIMAPFALAEGATADALGDTLCDLCAAMPPVQIPRLALSHTHGFLALRPAVSSAALSQMEARVVQALAPFRAPLTDEALARRRRARLSPRQEAYLTRWGYPYVMEEFNFHITLTGRLDRDAADTVCAALRGPLAPVLSQPLAIDALTLMGQPEGGNFHQLQRFALGAPAQIASPAQIGQV